MHLKKEENRSKNRHTNRKIKMKKLSSCGKMFLCLIQITDQILALQLLNLQFKEYSLRKVKLFPINFLNSSFGFYYYILVDKYKLILMNERLSEYNIVYKNKRFIYHSSHKPTIFNCRKCVFQQKVQIIKSYFEIVAFVPIGQRGQ